MEDDEWQLLGTGLGAVAAPVAATAATDDAASAAVGDAAAVGGVAGAAPAGPRAPADDDDDWMLPQDSDKPGFARWAETLLTREVTGIENACVGKWLPLEQAVELTQQRGKRFATTGFSQSGLRMLYPEEALFLLDEGGLYLTKPPPKRGWKAAADATAAESAKRQRRAAEAEAAAAAPAAAGAAAAPLVAAAAAPAAVSAAPPVAAPAVAGDAAPVPAADGVAAPASAGEAAAPGAAVVAAGTEVLPAAPAPAAPKPERAAKGKAGGAGAADAAPARDVMELPAAYELLARHCNMAHFQVYSQLRSAGLVVYRHRAYAHAHAAGDVAAKPRIVNLVLPTAGPEPVLQPVFDVYARDGITSFKPSAPGAPDFYVLVADASDAPPTARQIADLQRRLTEHMHAARKAQVLKVGDRADVALGPSANVPQVKFAIASHTTVTFYSVAHAVLPPPKV